MVEWLRKANLRLALLATENQWRLIYAGSDFDASCEWNLDLWFEAGQPALQVEALRRLLSPALILEQLISAIQDSRRGEAELSSELGENVRKAVEKLVQASAANLENLNVPAADIYLAATRMIMRCVVALFAEGKGMLGRDLPRYHDSYGVQGLREQLERARLANLHEQQFAWPRLVSLFRLIHTGSAHPELLVTRYGGALFEPGHRESDKPVLRAVVAFEKTDPCPNDREVYEILALLTRTYVNIRQGKTTRSIATPVDFSNLDTEYIGILYEGLLDYELKRASEPVVFVRMGDEPALPISQLETIAPAKLKDVFGKLKEKSQLAVSEDEGDEEDEEDSAEDEDASEAPDEVTESAESEDQSDDADASIARAHAWAVEAVKAGKLVPTPRSKRAEALRKYDEDVAAAARNLFSRVVRPGDWYLVRFGNTRKGSGTFYTRKELAGPTVRRTLQPLVYDAGTPRKPEEILALKVCDPACGSGSFLISVVRYLTEALFQSLYQHGRIHDAGNHTKLYDLGVRKEDLPATDDFDDQLRARLRRHIVERCLYGVDLNPLAVELARMSLWIETLDPRLPFGFLDHKLKTGNALVGCWFDRFEDYPAMAWAREGGDKDYEPVNPRPNWTKAISAEFRERIKPSLVKMINSGAAQTLTWDGEDPRDIADRARQRLARIHQLGVLDPAEQRAQYEELRSDSGFRRLIQAFNMWCALWFWPCDELVNAPAAMGFIAPTDDAERTAHSVTERFRFFHWELEFPDVFNCKGAGFNAVIGNPPCETQKPNSLEFFSNINPLYRTYGKQEALQWQREHFRTDSRSEKNWILERNRLKALGNWVKYAGHPFGDQVHYDNKGNPSFDLPLGRRFEDSKSLHALWNSMRQFKTSYVDEEHPFRLQGSADLNTYKMFIESGLKLATDGARLGIVCPGSVYSDFGASELRSYLLSRCSWLDLYVFQNEKFVFEGVHHSYKIAVINLLKGTISERVNACFRLGTTESPTVSELEEEITSAPRLPIDAEVITRFSPHSKALLEIRNEHDLRTLGKLYENGVLLGDRSQRGWKIGYAREFDMTNDSQLFPPRPRWEDQGYRSDEYGHWLKGHWQPYGGPKSILHRKRDLVLSADGTLGLPIQDIGDVALPLIEGRIIGQYDFSEKAWVSGKGRSAVWNTIPFSDKRLQPQYLMSISDYISQKDRNGNFKSIRGPKVCFMDVTAATNERTTIASVVNDMPCGHSAPVLVANDPWGLCAVLNTFAFDFQSRKRCAGLHLTYFLIADICLPSPMEALARIGICLTGISDLFAVEWKRGISRDRGWRQAWAITDHERLRLRCMADALTASAYGLTWHDLCYILESCALPELLLTDRTFARKLDPKGFWRVDKEKPPHLRHAVLSLVAFQELERVGLDAFLNMNDGEGWMLPEKLRLADYGLGHDDRAKEHQPVASTLGPRFYDWQLSQSVAESWEECEMHAELLNKIVPTAPPEKAPEPEQPQASLAF